MRIVYILFFALGVLTFIGAGAAAGGELGDILWRAGIAIMLTDVLVIQIWPARARPPAGAPDA